MTDAPPPTTPADPRPAGTAESPLDAGRDPVTGLRRMSKTAGVGMNDYAAISTEAVVALVLGLASPLVFFAPVLMAVPIAGVVVAALAIASVRGSNGTKTGLPLAVVGGLLSAGFLGWYVVSTLATDRLDAADRVRVEALVGELSEDLVAGDYDAAYDLFHPRFRDTIDPATFEEALKARQANPYYGQFQNITLSDVVRFESDPTTGGRVGQSLLIVELPPTPLAPGTTQPAEPPPPRLDRQGATFREEDGQWKVLNVGEWFAAPEQG